MEKTIEVAGWINSRRVSGIQILVLVLCAADLTGLFWTKLCEKLSLERSFGDAEEEVQRGADRCAASSD